MPHSNTDAHGDATVALQSLGDPATESASVGRRWMRRTIRWSDSLATRPMAALVFLASLVGFGALIAVEGGQAVEVTAVADAAQTLVESPLSTTVVRVHVKSGVYVERGQVLMTLDPSVVDRERESVEREIAALEAQLEVDRIQGHLQTDRLALEMDQKQQSDSRELQNARSRHASAQARIGPAQQWRDGVARLVAQGVESQSALMEADQQLAAANAERTLWATQARDAQGRSTVESVSAFDADALGAAQTQLTEARLDQWRLRRRHLEEDAARLVVRAPVGGRVSLLAPVGAHTQTLPSLATITPARADELVAYLPPSLPAHRVPSETSTARLSGCAAPAQVLRVGASVEQAPGQVQHLGLSGAVFGLPVYLSVPAECPVMPGALTQVEIQP